MNDMHKKKAHTKPKVALIAAVERMIKFNLRLTYMADKVAPKTNVMQNDAIAPIDPKRGIRKNAKIMLISKLYADTFTRSLEY